MENVCFLIVWVTYQKFLKVTKYIFRFLEKRVARVVWKCAKFSSKVVKLATLRKPLSVYVRDAFRISTWSLFSGLCFQARSSRHSLFFCWRLSNSVALLRTPLLDWRWIPCIHRKASCTEPRGLYRDGSVRIHVPCHPLKIHKINGLVNALFNLTSNQNVCFLLGENLAGKLDTFLIFQFDLNVFIQRFSQCISFQSSFTENSCFYIFWGVWWNSKTWSDTHMDLVYRKNIKIWWKAINEPHSWNFCKYMIQCRVICA